MYGKALEIPAMKVWKLPKGKEDKKKEVADSGKYFGQIKKDGWWYQYEKDDDGNSFLFSRSKSTVTGHLGEKSANVPHVMRFLDSITPNGTIIIGEIYFPDKKSNDVARVMGVDDANEAIRRQKEEFGWIHFYMHDMIRYKEGSLLDFTNEERYNALKQFIELYEKYEEDLPPFMELAEIYTEDLDQMIDDVIESGQEGMVLKLKTGKYIPDKKPAWNMIKFKQEDEADVICVGYEPPKKEYTGEEPETWQYWENYEGDIYFEKPTQWNEDEYMPVTENYAKGWIGAMRIAVYSPENELVEIGTVSSGISNSLFEEIKQNPDKYIGKPLKVKYMLAFENRLRHSAFVDWREDLNPEDCTWDKIFD